jgi:hypothetical protein
MPIFHEGRHLGEAILSEAEFGYSRDNLTIAASQTIEACSLLCRVEAAAGVTSTVTPRSGNTGNGVLTMATPAVTSDVKEGRYTVTITAAAANAGSFSVEGPDGTIVGEGTVAVAFAHQVKFTLADGGTDFVVGDQIYIDVDAAPGTGTQYAAWNPTATDSSQTPVAMAIYPAVTGSDETLQIAGITRQSQLNINCIAWPDGVTDAQKSAASDALRRVGIILR